MLVSKLLTDTANTHPLRRALWARGRWHTYGELSCCAASVAAALIDAGIQPGDRVCIFLENSAEYVAVHFGAHLAAAVEVSLNVELKGPGLRQLITNCGARALVTSLRAVNRWREELGGIESLTDIFVTEAVPAAMAAPAGCRLHSLENCLTHPETPRLPEPARCEDDLATLVYTSGSTGEPKGVMLSHRNLTSNTRAIVEYLGLHADDRMMVILPFHYIYGRSLLYTHFLSAGSLVIDNRFAFPAVILDAMQTHEVTCFAGVPSTFSILLNKTDVRTRTFPKLRMLTQAGGGMAPALQRDVVSAFPQARLFVMYGSTEAAPRLTYVEPEMLPSKWGSIGRAVPGVEVIVADQDGHALPQGEIGEVAARGPNIMLGYWSDPEGTSKVLRNGYYFTGDLGYMDADGYITLTGRSKDMIKTGGNRVSAKEIEDAIIEAGLVQEAAVVAFPDAILGEAIAAFVVPRGTTLTPRDVQSALAQRLPAFKVPKQVFLLGSLPKNSSGKVLKSALPKVDALVSSESSEAR